MRIENFTFKYFTTIFEGKAGGNCRFKETFWSSNKNLFRNAKKYVLLTQIETNSAYRNYFLGAN